MQVSVNPQLYRHLEDVRLQLSKFWASDEVILDTKDAETIEQGNFTPFVDAQICEK
jgi:hypothetical protein